MSIVQEADQGYNVPSAQTNTLIGSFTAPSGTDFLIFACSLYTSAGRQVTGLQFNGDAASKHDDFSPTVNGNMGSSIWYLANPDTGSSYEIRWWSSGAATVGDLLAIALSGVDLTTPFGTAAKAEGSTGTDGTVDVASTSDGLVIDVYSGRKTVTVGSGQTEYYSNFSKPSPESAMSYEAGDGGDVTMNWTLSASGIWSVMGTNVNAAAVGGVWTPPTKIIQAVRQSYEW